MHTPGTTWPENRTPEAPSLLTGEAGGNPASPFLSRASPDGSEQGMAGLDRIGQVSGL